MTILIKNVLLNGKNQDVFISGNKITEIGSVVSGDKIIDGSGKAIIPGLVNGHTHAAMSLLRGYADDMRVMDWLNTKIWPIEEQMTEEDVYWGSKLACLEMIKSGTTFFNDMYWHYHGTARAAEEMGMRADVSAVFIDMFDAVKAKGQIDLNKRLFEENKKYSSRIRFSLGPHAVYTVSKESLIWCKEFSEKNNVLIHIHLCESKKEADDCVEKYGMSPVEYLDSFGFLNSRVVACHSIWLSAEDIEILKRNNVNIIHNPSSNMKLSSGVFNYVDLKKAELRMGLGTDGCASNNNLDMLEEMKIAALLQKLQTNDPTVLPALDVFKMATNSSVFGLDYGLKVGCLADLVLVDLKKSFMVPNHNLISNLVYAAKGGCVSDVIIDGKIVMENGQVKGEEEILRKAEEAAKNLIQRSNKR